MRNKFEQEKRKLWARKEILPQTRKGYFPCLMVRNYDLKLLSYLRTIHNPTEDLCCHPGQQCGFILPPHTFGLMKSSKQIQLASDTEPLGRSIDSLKLIDKHGTKLGH